MGAVDSALRSDVWSAEQRPPAEVVRSSVSRGASASTARSERPAARFNVRREVASGEYSREGKLSGECENLTTHSTGRADSNSFMLVFSDVA